MAHTTDPYPNVKSLPNWRLQQLLGRPWKDADLCLASWLSFCSICAVKVTAIRSLYLNQIRGHGHTWTDTYHHDRITKKMICLTPKRIVWASVVSFFVFGGMAAVSWKKTSYGCQLVCTYIKIVWLGRQKVIAWDVHGEPFKSFPKRRIITDA